MPQAPPRSTAPPTAQSGEKTPDLYMQIGQRLKRAREAKRLSQDELGALVGEGAIAISRWETASRKPNVEDLAKLAAALDQSILYFVEEVIPQDNFVARLNRLAGELDETDREDLLALARFKHQRYVERRLQAEEEKKV